MTEARIECLCPEYHVGDLRLRMRRGSVAWVSEEAARASDDLRIAVRSGAVTVLYTRRCSVSRLPPPPAARMGSILRSAGVASRARPEPSAPSVGAASVSPGDIEAAVAAGVSRAITDLVASGVLVWAGAAAARPTAAPASIAAVVDAADPVYIPTNIVPADGVPSITVAQSSSGGSDIDAAAAALKATRRRKSVEPK